MGCKLGVLEICCTIKEKVFQMPADCMVALELRLLVFGQLCSGKLCVYVHLRQ